MSFSDEPIFSGKSDLERQIEAVLLDAGKACQAMAIKHISQSCMTGGFKNEIRRVLDQHGVQHMQEGDVDDLKARIAALEAENLSLCRQLDDMRLNEIRSMVNSRPAKPGRPYTAEMESTAKRLAAWLNGAALLSDSRIPDTEVYGTRGSFHLTIGDMRRFVAAFT